jgi:hypothetical protein
MLAEVRRAVQFRIGSQGAVRILFAAIAIALLIPTAALAQDTTTLLLLRPVPKAKKIDPSIPVAPLVQSDIAEIKIGGKPATITAWTPLLKGPTTLQLVVLLDPAHPFSASSQVDDLRSLFKRLPVNVEIAVGTMLEGKTKIIQPFTTDHTLAGAALHLPSKEEAAGPKADNGDPYYCLQDLAAHWPDPDPTKVRAVLVFTDGAVRYNNSGYASQTNPTVDIAAQSLLRAGIAPFAIYSAGLPGTAMVGQMERKGCTDCLDQLAATTNGQALYAQADSPTPDASFSPLLYRFYAILYTEAVVTVTSKGSGLRPLDIKASREDIKVAGPESIMIGNVLPKK